VVTEYIPHAHTTNSHQLSEKFEATQKSESVDEIPPFPTSFQWDLTCNSSIKLNPK
jgi:hypothetical protein